VRAGGNIVNFDPYFSEKLTSIYGGWLERLVADDWTLDPAVWDYRIPWHPDKYLKANWPKVGNPGTGHSCCPSA